MKGFSWECLHSAADDSQSFLAFRRLGVFVVLLPGAERKPEHQSLGFDVADGRLHVSMLWSEHQVRAGSMCEALCQPLSPRYPDTTGMLCTKLPSATNPTRSLTQRITEPSPVQGHLCLGCLPHYRTPPCPSRRAVPRVGHDCRQLVEVFLWTRLSWCIKVSSVCVQNLLNSGSVHLLIRDELGDGNTLLDCL